MRWSEDSRWGLALAVGLATIGPAAGQVVTSTESPFGQSLEQETCDGALFPYWGNEDDGTSIPLFIAYMLALIYTFGGVGVAADVFMGSIEAITASTKLVTLGKGEQTRSIDIEVWNKTVSNLSLMALGSSAPEILLAIVELIGNGFEAGDLGPGTIVGSAAFNMLMIIAICVSIEPVKRVEGIIVLYITAAASVFAYVWLYIIVEVWTPQLCTIEEAAITCAFFPLLLLIAFCADRGWLDGDVCSHAVKKARSSFGSGMLDTKSPTELALEHLVSVGNVHVNASGTSEWKRDLRRAIRQVGRENPSYTQEEIYVAAFELVRQHPHSPVLHTYTEEEDSKRRHDSAGRPIRMASTPLVDTAGMDFDGDFDDATAAVAGIMPTARVGFLEGVYDCTQNVGKLMLTVERKGNMHLPLRLLITTKDATAKEGTHYVMDPPTKIVEFIANQKASDIGIDIIEDDQFHPNRHFCIGLSAAAEQDASKIKWTNRSVKIRIVESYQFKSTWDWMVKSISSFFEAILSDEPAVNAYTEQIRCSLRFDEDDDEDDEDDEEDDPDTAGVFVEEGKQIGDDITSDGAEDNAIVLHSYIDWLLYFFMILPKFLMAVFTPPVTVAKGWATFFFSLCWIALYTSICADLASQMGCTVGLKDTVTAVTFVALGTSVPDTFASKIAAEQDPNADPAIGNVTGSNAVNVFLGIGLSWLIGSIYQVTVNDKDGLAIPDSALGFSVMVFSIMAIIWFAVLTARRYVVGGELGGSGIMKWGTVILFVMMWLIFVILVSLVEYGHVEGF